MTIPIPKMLTLDKAAAALGLTVAQLRWLRSQGRGPASARVGGRVYFREGDLADWANNHFDGTTKEEQ